MRVVQTWRPKVIITYKKVAHNFGTRKREKFTQVYIHNSMHYFDLRQHTRQSSATNHSPWRILFLPPARNNTESEQVSSFAERARRK
jgi:hypothetical protein